MAQREWFNVRNSREVMMSIFIGLENGIAIKFTLIEIGQHIQNQRKFDVNTIMRGTKNVWRWWHGGSKFLEQINSMSVS